MTTIVFPMKKERQSYEECTNILNLRARKVKKYS